MTACLRRLAALVAAAALSGCSGSMSWSDLNPFGGSTRRPLEAAPPIVTADSGVSALARQLGAEEAGAVIERALQPDQLGKALTWTGEGRSGTVTLVRTGRIPSTGQSCREIEATTQQDGTTSPAIRSLVACDSGGRWVAVAD